MTSRTLIADDADAIARRLAELRGDRQGGGSRTERHVEHFPDDDWAILKASVRVDRDRPSVVPARVLP